MITSSPRKQMWHPDRGLLHIDARSAAFAPGQPLPPVERIYQWVEQPLLADWWSQGAIERFMKDPRCPIDTDGVIVIDAPVCGCCGQPFYHGMDTLACVVAGRNPRVAQYRCERHMGRNPCAIEGCHRTTAASQRYSHDKWLCQEHWRRFVPPHSPLRRTYRRFWRLAKKQATPDNPTGWSDALLRRFHRFWDAVISRARRQSSEGRLDEAEINKLFGWDEAS